MNHILLDEYKKYKNIDLTNTDEDPQLNIVLSGVTNYLLNQYGIVLEQTQLVDEFYISTNTNKIFINTDVVSIDKVYEDNIEQDINNYKFFNGILRKLLGNFPLNKYVRIEYTVGYPSVDSIPDGIKLAIFIFADKIYEDIQNNANLISSLSDPVGGREVFKKYLPKEIKLLLAPYYYINI